MPSKSSLTPEKNRLKLLYLRLTDSAPLVVAREMGFFEKFGLEVELQQETSWATLRDKLIGGTADAAAMLAPMALTLQQTLPQCRESLVSGLIMSCNGNAITLSSPLFNALGKDGNTSAAGSALATHLHNRSPGAPPLRFATVYPFSSHTLQLRHWLRTSGIDPNTEIELQVLPPEQMVSHLRAGDIDGCCVGEPWNSLAAQEGSGAIAATCNTLMPGMPEKVLAVTSSWHEANPATHLALRAALLEACAHLNDQSQRRDAAGLLAREEFLDLPENAIAASFGTDDSNAQRKDLHEQGGWHLFAHPDSDIGRPTATKARELLALCNEIAPVSSDDSETFRDDLYQQTLDFLSRSRCTNS